MCVRVCGTSVAVPARVQRAVRGALCLGRVCDSAPSISVGCFNPGHCPGEILSEASASIRVSPMSCFGISADRLIGAVLR
eukprot:3575519-Alexandrium_andersonii.AAC.1